MALVWYSWEQLDASREHKERAGQVEGQGH
jgi:hypothetical protein